MVRVSRRAENGTAVPSSTAFSTTHRLEGQQPGWATIRVVQPQPDHQPRHGGRGHWHVRRHTRNKPCDHRRQASGGTTQVPTINKPRLGICTLPWSVLLPHTPSVCFALWDRSSLRPSQADCHHIAATIASNSGELGSVASSGLAQGRLESICILWPGPKTPPGLC